MTTKKTKLPNPPRQSVLWVREYLGDRSVFGFSLFLAYLLLTAIMRISVSGVSVYESLDDAIVDWAWILISRSVVFFLVAAALKAIRSGLATPVLNSLAAGFISFASLTADYFLYPDDKAIFKYGFVPTVLYVAALTIYAYGIFAPVLVGLRKYQAGAKDLKHVQLELKAYVDEIDFKSELAEQIRKSQLQAIVLPQLQKIRETLDSGNKASIAAISDIRNLIENSVRPLSQKIASDRVTLRPTVIERPVLTALSAFWVARPLAENFRPLTWLLTLGPLYLVGDIVIYGTRVIQVNLITTLIWALACLGIALAIPKRIRVNGFFGALIAGVVGYVIGVPLDHQIAVEMGDFSAINLVYVASLADGFGFIFLMALSGHITSALEEVVARRNAKLQSIKLHIAEFNRNQWVAQRNWSYLLHGKIQAGLSVALIRLSGLSASGKSISPATKRKQIREVSELLDGVIQTLQDPKIIEVNLFNSLNEQRDLWAGACDIRINLPENVESRLSHDPNARFALNELAGEAITNAVKHAEAKKLNLSFELGDEGELLFKAENDGKAPSKAISKSMGSALFDDLAESWSLVRTGKKTVLKATVRLAAS